MTTCPYNGIWFTIQIVATENKGEQETFLTCETMQEPWPTLLDLETEQKPKHTLLDKWPAPNGLNRVAAGNQSTCILWVSMIQKPDIDISPIYRTDFLQSNMKSPPDPIFRTWQAELCGSLVYSCLNICNLLYKAGYLRALTREQL